MQAVEGVFDILEQQILPITQWDHYTLQYYK